MQESNTTNQQLALVGTLLLHTTIQSTKKLRIFLQPVKKPIKTSQQSI